jgi:hypothetical protein
MTLRMHLVEAHRSMMQLHLAPGESDAVLTCCELWWIRS